MRLAFVGRFAIAVTCVLAPLSAQTAAQKNAIGMEFMKIPAGEFMMGCSAGDSACENDEKPQHRVRITKAFEMGKYEVTQAQWKAVMKETEYSSVFVGDNNPVENVTRAEAIDFANRLTMRNDGYRYRLPTEAEWEYAARAGTTGVTYGPLEEIAWFGKNSDDESHPVGGKKPNAWGLYDMFGNVREWTADTYQPDFYANSPVDDPTGPPANYGERGQPGYAGGAGVALPVIRGGGWPNPESFLRVSDRYHYFGPTLRVSDVGFRLRSPAGRRRNNKDACLCLSLEVSMKRTLILLGAAMAILPVAAVAHHSFAAEYDGSKPMTLVGAINKVDQQNPHGFFYMNVPSDKPGGRVTNWALETPGPNQLVRTGFTREMYQEMVDNKEQVTVKAYPARDGSKRAFAETITRADGRTVITISVGGVDSNVGRAPRGDAVTVDGVPVPDPTAGAARGRGGAGGRGQPRRSPAVRVLYH